MTAAVPELREALRAEHFQQVASGVFMDREGALWSIDTTSNGALSAAYAIDEHPGWEFATEQEILDAKPFRLLGHRVHAESLADTIASANSIEDAALRIRFRMLNSGMTPEEVEESDELYITDCELHNKIGEGLYTDNHTETSIYDARGSLPLVYANDTVVAMRRSDMFDALYPLSVVLPVRSLMSMLDTGQSASETAQSIYELSAAGIK